MDIWFVPAVIIFLSTAVLSAVHAYRGYAKKKITLYIGYYNLDFNFVKELQPKLYFCTIAFYIIASLCLLVMAIIAIYFLYLSSI